jgi:hypothetical protein
MFKFIFEKWKQIGKHNYYFAVSVDTANWSFPINIAWAARHLRLSVLCFCFVVDVCDIGKFYTEKSV